MKEKILFLLVAVIALPIFSIAQCDGPQNVSWEANSDVQFTIWFEASSDAVSYQLTISQLYFDNQWPSEPTIFEGNVSEGLNEIQLDLGGLDLGGLAASEYYFGAQLSLTCADLESSATQQFYLSEFSIINDPAYNFGPFLFNPITLLPDQTDVPFDSYFPISSEEAQEIESISVFVDIGHSFNGDLSIEMISPAGTSVIILDVQNGLVATRGLSVIFSDNATEELTANSTRQGIFLPNSPLSAFQGESPEGVWLLRVVDNFDADQGVLFGTALIINGVPCYASVSGNVFYDYNQNDIIDNEEPPYSSSAVYNSLDGDLSGISLNGYYSDCVTVGSGELSLSSLPLYHTSSPVQFTTSEGDQLENLDIALTPVGEVADLVVDVYTLTPDRPGFENTYYIDFENIGTECVSDVALSIVFEEVVTLLEVDADSYSIANNTVLVSIGELCPQESGQVVVQTLNSEEIELGYLLGVFAELTPTVGDETPDNNLAHHVSEVVGSYDPNDKMVNQSTINQAFLQNGEALKYKVRFQNTGSYYAERVLVVDTIDANLDPSTIQILGNSHPMEVSNNGNVFYFEFDDIFLPDSTADLDGSMGFFRYSIEPYENTLDGTEIENTAAIFFDFNAPIITNTVTTLVDFASSVIELEYEANLYPNPVGYTLFLSLPVEAGWTTARVVDLSGKQVASQQFQAGAPVQIDVTDLAPGMYFVHFDAAVEIGAKSWVKQ